MELSPDTWVFWQSGTMKLNATIVFSWIVMALLVVSSRFATRGIKPRLVPKRWQAAMETIVVLVRDQIEEIAPGRARRYLPFVATLFLFIFTSNILAIVPGYKPPTASLSTTMALALLVLVAVPFFAISAGGVGQYLKTFISPSLVMLPFNLISELSRTISLAVRLYGNVMSGVVIGAILLSVAPLFFPVAMQVLGLLTGVIQACIFAVLATVYIAAASPRTQSYTDKDVAHG